MNYIVKSHFICSSDCMRVALANFLHEIMMVRDGLLSLPSCVGFTWSYRRSFIQCLCLVLSSTVIIVLTACLSVLSVGFYNK